MRTRTYVYVREPQSRTSFGLPEIWTAIFDGAVNTLVQAEPSKHTHAKDLVHAIIYSTQHSQLGAFAEHFCICP